MRLILLLFILPSVHCAIAQTFYVKFPNDSFPDPCIASGYGTAGIPAGEPEFYNPDSLPLVALHEDQIYGICQVACACIERNWKVYNPATYDSTRACTYIPHPLAVPVSGTSIGPVISPIATPGDPWSATISKINPNDSVPINFSQFWSDTANCYLYKQRVLILDDVPPVIDTCLATPVVLADTSSNDPYFWNEPLWIDPSNGSHDLPESPLELSISAFDSCTSLSVGIDYQLFLDLDQDDTLETVVCGLASVTPGIVKFGNALNPNFSGGEPRFFDNRSVPDNRKYQFGVDAFFDLPNNRKIARIRWFTPYSPVIPMTDTMVQLPPGHHKIRWIITDGCGNETYCEYPVNMTSVVNTNAPGDARYLLHCAPNPFRDQTQVRFSLPADSRVILRVFAATGALILEETKSFPPGEQQFPLSKFQLDSKPGLYFITLETKQYRAIGKLILLP